MDGQSFIVRFYRFEDQEPENVIGTVKAAESDLCLNFRGMTGLWQAMTRLKALAGQRKQEEGQ